LIGPKSAPSEHTQYTMEGNTMDNQDFVIIGGSSGIGLEITRRLLHRNHRVTVIARSADTMDTPDPAIRLRLDIV